MRSFRNRDTAFFHASEASVNGKIASVRFDPLSNEYVILREFCYFAVAIFIDDVLAYSDRPERDRVQNYAGRIPLTTAELKEMLDE